MFVGGGVIINYYLFGKKNIGEVIFIAVFVSVLFLLYNKEVIFEDRTKDRLN